MKFQFIYSLPAMIFGLAAISFTPADVRAADMYSFGHGDIGVEYEGGGEFHLHAHIHGGAIVNGLPLPDDEEYHGDDLIIRVPASANLGRAAGIYGGSFENYDFTGSGYDFLGTGVGQDLWILPFDSADADQYETPFFGWASEELVNSDWDGSIEFSLTGFSGPGEFSVFSSVGTRRFDSQDANFVNDQLFIGAGSHSHFFLAFTAPGLYEVEITATGMHKVDGVATGTETFFFQVVPEPGTATLLGFSGLAMVASAARHRRGRKRIRLE